MHTRHVLTFLALVLVSPACTAEVGGGDEPAPLPPPRDPSIDPEPTAVIPSDDPSSPFSSDVFVRGLEAWRRPHPKGACASCHSMDATDLAFFAYTDAEITRRALGNDASVEDAPAVVALVRFQRERLGFDAPVDPVAYIPFQPGGEVLPGETAFDRERALLAELAAMDHPYLRHERVEDSATALAALREIAAIDLRSVRIGFELPRWTADSFRGARTHTYNDWIPDFPSFPREGTAEAWYTLHNAYIEDPSEENLWRVVDAVEASTDTLGLAPEGETVARTFGRLKYEAVLVAAHMLRRGTANRPDPGYDLAEREGSGVQVRDLRRRTSIFWDVGASIGSGGTPSTRPETWPAMLRDKELVLSSRENNAFRDDSRMPLARAWFWLGFMYDPPMQFTAGGNRTEYFPAHLTRDGYLLHNALAASTMAAHLLFAKDTRYPGPGNGFRSRFANGHAAALFAASMSGFGPNLGRERDGYPEDLREALRRFWINDLRAQVYALEASLIAGDPVFEKDAKLRSFASYRERLESLEDPARWPALRDDLDRIDALLAAAHEERVTPAEREVLAIAVLGSGERSSFPLVVPDAMRVRSGAPFGEAYAVQCAGCHGHDAGGRGPGGEVAGEDGSFGGYPSLRGYASESAFVAVVRGGSSTTRMAMPAFSPAMLSDEALREMFERLR